LEWHHQTALDGAIADCGRRTRDFQVRIERGAERPLTVADEACFHAQKHVAETGHVRLFAGSVVMRDHLDIGRDIQFHIEIFGEAKPEIGIGVQVSVGDYAVHVLQRGIEDVGLYLKMPGIDGAGSGAFGRPIRAERSQRIVGHGVDQGIIKCLCPRSGSVEGDSD
jgi:hypothetical protein